MGRGEGRSSWRIRLTWKPKELSLNVHGFASTHIQGCVGEDSQPRLLQIAKADPRDLVQVKYEMLRRVQSEGHSNNFLSNALTIASTAAAAGKPVLCSPRRSPGY